MSRNTKQMGPFAINGKGLSKENIVNAFTLRLTGADLKIDHKPRRKNKTPHRRALVHDFKDGLTLNWAKDYPGGVTIKGNVNVPDKLIVKNKDVMTLITALQKKITNLEKLYDMIDWENS